MYARLQPTNYWLQWLGLTQRTNLELMRQRLAGTMDHAPLDRFASILEPVKGYSRGAHRYQTNTPLDRLVDSLPPESDAARRFRDAVDAYLAKTPNERDSKELRDHLTRWQEDSHNARPVFTANSILTENLAVADAVEQLCQAGIQALQSLDADTASANIRDAAWKQRTSDAVKASGERKGDILIQIAPGVGKLVDAVNVSSSELRSK
jgi:hexosaminidase